MKISLLIAAFNERESIAQLIEEIDELTSDQRSFDWQLVVVDDGSSDGTWEEFERISVSNCHVTAIRHRRNSGKSAAIRTGLGAATGDIIVSLDADLQDDPSEIPAMIAKLINQEADLIVGYKQKRKDPIHKRWPSKLFNAATSRVTGLRIRDHNCGLKAGWAEVWRTIDFYGEMHRYFAAMAHCNGYRVSEQVVNHRARIHGASKFGWERYARGLIDLLTVVLVTRFRGRPAHLFGGIGLIIGLVGFSLLTYLSIDKIVFGAQIGDRPLLNLGSLLLVVSVQLLSLGVLAELVLRTQTTSTSKNLTQTHISKVIELEPE